MKIVKTSVLIWHKLKIKSKNIKSFWEFWQLKSIWWILLIKINLCTLFSLILKNLKFLLMQCKILTLMSGLK